MAKMPLAGGLITSLATTLPTGYSMQHCTVPCTHPMCFHSSMWCITHYPTKFVMILQFDQAVILTRYVCEQTPTR